MKKIMFICSGNTCRSPLAEGLFKKYLKDNNMTDIQVGSAGVGAFPGDDVSINSILVAGSRGVDISDHRARNINPDKIAKKVLKIIKKRKPSFAYSINRNPLLLLLNFLPKRIQLWIIRQILK